MIAKRPASVTNIICRLADRGAGGAGGPASSRPPVIDLANNRFRSNFIWPMRLDLYGRKFPNKAGLHLRHGYRDGSGPVCTLFDEDPGRPVRCQSMIRKSGNRFSLATNAKRLR